jgi:predicted RNA-binding Zn ribbon-like protein
MKLEHYSIDIPYDALGENLVNTYDVSLAEPEHLRVVEDLRRFVAQHGLDAAETTARDLAKVRALRSAARRVFESSDAAQAARRVNALLDGKGYAAKLSVRDRDATIDWRTAIEGPLSRRLEAAVALNLAALLETIGFDRYRVCKAAPCRDVFVDTSKKGGRIFCGSRCASRIHVARFRSRLHE